MPKYQSELRTILQKGRPYGFEEKRVRRIEEAISYESGTMEIPRKHIIAELPNCVEVYFQKPGKETIKKNPNLYDMTPLVGEEKKLFEFQDIWEYLINVAIADECILKTIGVLVYRVGYMLDHAENRAGLIRYAPKNSIQDCISKTDRTNPCSFPAGLNGLLNFIDILGWNEDVKYHTEDGRPCFNGKYQFKVGRVNTILSCLTVPFLTWEFIKNVLSHKDDRFNIESKLIFDVMQRFARSRGVCVPSQTELLDWLSPYLVS
jgi:hypothetical protein